MISAHEIKLQSMTTYVRVMYVLDKETYERQFLFNVSSMNFYDLLQLDEPKQMIFFNCNTKTWVIILRFRELSLPLQ